MQNPHPSPSARARPVLALRKALLLGAALLIAPAFAAPRSPVLIEPSAFVATAEGKKAAKKTTTAKKKDKAEAQKPGPLADFGEANPPPDVLHVANWVSHTRNHKKKAFVLIDKKKAQLYVFDPKGKLKSHTPILLGKAVGDHTVPGVGNKPMKQIKEDEKTTPAGRFLAQPGRNTKGEDIIWIDYNASVSMHRLRKVSAAEQRAQRMETEDASDNRISYGCVNVPPQFYNSVLKPTVTKHGAYVYVLPETRTPQQQFGSFDVAPDQAKPVRVAEAAGKAGK